MKFFLLKFFLLTIVVVLVLSGCVTSPVKQSKLTHHFIFTLSDIPIELQNRSWLERFSINVINEKHKKVQHELLLQTELTNTQINFVAMDLTGLPLIQAKWNSKTQEILADKLIHSEVTDKLDIKKMIHDLQAANWPILSLKNSLKAKFQIQEKNIQDKIIREFFYQKEVILLVEKASDNIQLKYPNLGYEISIQRLSDNPLKN